MADFAVIIADMQASRKMRERERYEWQLFLKSAIVQLNETYIECIEAPFMITKGDEFQGVLKRMAPVNQLMSKFEQLTYPLHLRFGVGYGYVQKMGSDIPIEMDGPAFHLANAALEYAKKKKILVRISTTDLIFDRALNTIFQLIHSLKRGWSDLNYRRYWKYRDLGTLQKVANEAGVSSQSVWESLFKSGALDVLQADRAIDELLKDFDRLQELRR